MKISNEEQNMEEAIALEELTKQLARSIDRDFLNSYISEQFMGVDPVGDRSIKLNSST